jgi:hypothetical protein
MRYVRRAIVGAALCIATIVTAKADPISITDLLQRGYEIKSSHAVQLLEGATGSTAYRGDHDKLSAGRVGHFIMLQKSDSAYWCSNLETKYINQFQCWTVQGTENDIWNRPRGAVPLPDGSALPK